jgi:aspartate-semialdehyde dehydrogenase
MVMALAPLHKRYGIERVVVSTYQSITGTGVKAVQQLEDEYDGVDGEKAYPHPIHRNALPHCDVFLDNGYTKEEMKLVNETHKILDPSIQVTATAVRIPVVGGHSEAVNLTLSKTPDLEDIRDLLNNTPGVVVVDNLQNNEYPMPLNAEGKDEVFVGRIRKDESQDKGINLWIVADNLRKGAATNTVQIAEYLMRNVEAI